MADSAEVVDFEAIEGHKENIQALPSGRSAKKLAALLSPRGPLQQVPTPTETRNANDATRMQFEAEIASIDDESDDPLDVYHRYVQWTLEAYPSSQATPQSGLRTLLERATKTFVGSDQYRNDPRYLRLWVHYISFFSDAPREAYVFLSRHGIGDALALFYEEYAAWLEGAGRWIQAEEIYGLGIEREAQPAARLLRKFGDFKRRRERHQEQQQQSGANDGPTSPALPATRPILGVKVDPFALSGPGPVDPQASRLASGVGRPAAAAAAAAVAGGGAKPGKAKMAIFSDATNAPPPGPRAAESRGPGTQGWDSIGTIADRKKENTMEARPWAGETLPQAGGKKPPAAKLAIFRDPTRLLQTIKQKAPPMLPSVVINPSQHQVTVHPQTGKKERVFVDLVMVYPRPEEAGSELSFEEIWAANRGWMDVDWDAINAEEGEGEGEYVEESQQEEGEPMDMDDDVGVDMDVDEDVEMSTEVDTGTDHGEGFSQPQKVQAALSPPQKLVVRQDTIRVDDKMDLVPNLSRKVEKMAIRQDSPVRSQLERDQQERDQRNTRLQDVGRAKHHQQEFPDQEPRQPLHSHDGQQNQHRQLQHQQHDQNHRAPMQPKAQSVPVQVPLRKDEDGLLRDENGNVMAQSKESRPRKKKVMEVNETQIIKAKLDSPSKPKIKKRGVSTAEPTMTMHTRAATDDIYDIFNQPLKPGGYVQPEDEGEITFGTDHETDDETDYGTEGDCTSVGDSEGLTQQEVEEEDDDVDDGKSVASQWSDFTAPRPLARGENEDGQHAEATEDGHNDTDNRNEGRDEDRGGHDDDDEDSPPRTRTVFVPVPPEDYEAPTRPYRDAAEMANNRLPFMTPIVERTEMSMSLTLEASRRRDQHRRLAAHQTPSRVDALGHVDEDDGDEDGRNGYRNDDGASESSLSSVDEDLIKFERTLSPIRFAGLESPSPNRVKNRLPLLLSEVSEEPRKRSGGAVAGQAAKTTMAPTTAPTLASLIVGSLVSPTLDKVQAEILARMEPPLTAFPGFFDLSGELYGQGGEIRRYAKAFVKAKASMGSNMGGGGSGSGSGGGGGDKTSLPRPVIIQLPGAAGDYTVIKELGAGAFAPVYLIQNSGVDKRRSTTMTAISTRSSIEALKMSSPPTAWEFRMMRLVHDKLGPDERAVESLSKAHELHLYRDEAFLVLQYHPHGTLLDVVNLFRPEPSGVMDETLAMFFTVELLRTVDALHSRGLLHGDIKADNCMLRLNSEGGDGGGGSSDSLPPLNSRYRADGSDGWRSRGLSLIDFGRAIDMADFEPDVQFMADWKPTLQDCAEIREGRPWTWQIDYYGVAGIVHCLLFGRYMETTTTTATAATATTTSTTTTATTTTTPDQAGAGEGASPDQRRCKLRDGLKRYWQTDIWGECFDVLLNPAAHARGEPQGRMPVLAATARVRARMEDWLEANSERGVGLRGGLAKVEAAVARRRR